MQTRNRFSSAFEAALAACSAVPVKLVMINGVATHRNTINAPLHTAHLTFGEPDDFYLQSLNPVIFLVLFKVFLSPAGLNYTKIQVDAHFNIVHIAFRPPSKKIQHCSIFSDLEVSTNSTLHLLCWSYKLSINPLWQCCNTASLEYKGKNSQIL